MPEIIEVKKYTDFIYKYFNNKLLYNIKIINGRYKKHGAFKYYNFIKNKLPLKIINVSSKGKFMYITLENDYYIGVTLGLTGGWFYQQNINTDLIYGLHNMVKYKTNTSNKYIKTAINHINIQFIFESGILHYYDMLSFGTVKIFTNSNLLNDKLKLIGLDIMDNNTTSTMFINKINKNSNLDKYIGNVLLNQKIISGIGNYLRADTLWMSQISPFRKIKNITDTELITIFNNIRTLTWTDYNKNKGIKLKIIKKNIKTPSDYNLYFFIINKEIDIFGNKITKQKLYDGSQIRYIYWVKNYQF